MSAQGFFKAVKYFGSQQALAKAIGVSPQAVNHWIARENNMPYIQALKIFVLTKGDITLDELAPQHRELNALFGSSILLANMQPHCNQNPGVINGEN